MGAELRGGVRASASQRTSTPILSPQTLAATEQMIEHYRDIASRGGWQPVQRRRTACASAPSSPAWSPCASA